MEKLERSDELEEANIGKDVVRVEAVYTEGGLSELSEVTRSDKMLLCNPCLFDETEETAVGFCVICVEYLCQGCCRDHKKSENTRSHNILKEDLPEDVTVFRLMKEMTSCSEHSDVQVSHKCEDHNVYVCVMCIAGNHRKCDHVTELVKEVEPTNTRQMETAEKMAALHEKSTQVIKTRQENMTTLVAEKDEIQNNNAACLQQIYDKLASLEEDAIIKTENVTESEMSHLQKDIDICKSLENERMMFSKLLDTAKQYGSNTDIDIITSVTQEKVSRIDRILNKQQKKRDIHLRFMHNPIESKITTLGNLKVIRGDQIETESRENNASQIEDTSDEIIDQDDSACASPNTRAEHSPRGSGINPGGVKDKKKTKGQQKKQKPIKKEKNFPVKVSGDENDCSVTGIVILQDGRVAVIDQENRKIKLYSSGDCRFLFAHALDAPPNGICSVGPATLAVVYKDLRQIGIYTIDGQTLKDVRSWKTKYENVRIAMDRDLIAVLCKTDRDAIVQFRRETDCKVLLEASVSDYTGPGFDFDGCSLSSSKDELIVASRSSGILCLVRTPNLESLAITRTLNFNDVIPGLRGVAADKDGNLYACAPSSRSVIQISSKDYKQIKTVISDIDMPVSLAINKKKDRVIVGCQNDNFLHVFNLQQ